MPYGRYRIKNWGQRTPHEFPPERPNPPPTAQQFQPQQPTRYVLPSLYSHQYKSSSNVPGCVAVSSLIVQLLSSFSSSSPTTLPCVSSSSFIIHVMYHVQSIISSHVVVLSICIFLVKSKAIGHSYNLLCVHIVHIVHLTTSLISVHQSNTISSPTHPGNE